MKKILFVAAILAAIFSVNAQSGKVRTCCSALAKDNQFALLTARADFKDAHLSPKPLNFVAEKGEMVTFNTPDGKTANAFAVKGPGKTNKVVLVFHEWWGLNDYIKREAEMLQKELGYVDVYAIDLYDGKVTASADSAGILMGSLKSERAANIVKGAIELVGKDAQIGTLGWCMGGSWSFQAALLAGDQAKACVMYYGFPEKDINKMQSLKSDVLYIRASKDSFIPKPVVDQFVKDLKSVGKKIEVKEYSADHAFANPSNPKFEKDMAENARRVSSTYLRQKLGL